MNTVQKSWYDRGYIEQEWGYPLLDHAWSINPWSKYPKKYQKYYKRGQIQAFIDGNAKKPWFI